MWAKDVAKHAEDVAKHAENVAKHAQDVAKHAQDVAKHALGTHNDFQDPIFIIQYMISDNA